MRILSVCDHRCLLRMVIPPACMCLSIISRKNVFMLSDISTSRKARLGTDLYRKMMPITWMPIPDDRPGTIEHTVPGSGAGSYAGQIPSDSKYTQFYYLQDIYGMNSTLNRGEKMYLDSAMSEFSDYSSYFRLITDWFKNNNIKIDFNIKSHIIIKPNEEKDTVVAAFVKDSESIDFKNIDGITLRNLSEELIHAFQYFRFCIMKTIVVFLIGLFFSSIVMAQESKHFRIDSLSSKNKRTVFLKPINSENIRPEILSYGDTSFGLINFPQWNETMADLCSRVFKDLPFDRKEFLKGVFIVVAFNQEGKIGNEHLFIPGKRFDEIFVYEESLYQYILELRKISMSPYVDISNPAEVWSGLRRIKLNE